MSQLARGRSAAAMLVGLLAAACLAAAATPAAGTAGHPWHDSIAEVRARPALGRLEMSLRIDAAHLERAVSELAGQSIDLERVAVGSAEDGFVADYLARHVRGRLRLAGGGSAAMDFHWVGRELDGPDCRVYVELLAPPITAADPAAGDPAELRFPVELRVDPLLPDVSRHVVTVSVLDGETPVFAVDRRGWQRSGVRVGLRTPRPLVTVPALTGLAPAAATGTIAYHLPDPGTPPGEIRATRDALTGAASVSQVITLGWPGLDGEAPPPDAVGWPDWVARSLPATAARPPAATSDSGGPPDGPVRLLVLGPAAAGILKDVRLPAGFDAAVVLDGAVPRPSDRSGNAAGGWTLAERASRYRAELAARKGPTSAVIVSHTEATEARRTRRRAAIMDVGRAVRLRVDDGGSGRR